jgi:hypothetical protein
LSLVLPVYWKYSVEWFVEDRRYRPRLGDEYRNARLGINSHLGQESWPSAALSTSEVSA